MNINVPQPNKRLARLVQELLDLDSLQDATRVLRATLQSIKAALLNGETVYVKGFGTFRVVERTHRPTPNNILTNDSHGPTAYAQTLRHYKPRRVVIFEPSLPLMAMINMDSPNYKERRCTTRWRRGAQHEN